MIIKIFKYLIVIFLLISCHDDNCEKHINLNSNISISGWKETDVKIEKIYLIRYIDNFNTVLDSVNLTSHQFLTHHNNIRADKEKVYIALNNKIETKLAYRFVLNDTIKYDIYNFLLNKVTKKTGIKEINFCELAEYTVNGHIINNKGSNSLVFSK
ncbi:hypothetical protein [Aquimarina muelleri]|uniref:Uncharacterized protein n=1 Tax=Aquimarina muelleri TaxID=279356 RepID=A0A918N2U5_9FLAO|nr:hypothetical protein [Aquimarina muelleri]MCX2761762.1 hypothetical protein [Aquimarina muelleri]GGX15994.1 hypothetical protein GCM10007384_16930 [Aquimarina muelleri]